MVDVLLPHFGVSCPATPEGDGLLHRNTLRAGGGDPRVARSVLAGLDRVEGELSTRHLQREVLLLREVDHDRPERFLVDLDLGIVFQNAPGKWETEKKDMLRKV